EQPRSPLQPVRQGSAAELSLGALLLGTVEGFAVVKELVTAIQIEGVLAILAAIGIDQFALGAVGKVIGGCQGGAGTAVVGVGFKVVGALEGIAAGALVGHIGHQHMVAVEAVVEAAVGLDIGVVGTELKG